MDPSNMHYFSFIKKMFSIKNPKRLCKKDSVCGTFAEVIIAIIFVICFMALVCIYFMVFMMVGVCFDTSFQNYQTVPNIMYCDGFIFIFKIIGGFVTLTFFLCVFNSCYRVKDACDGVLDLEKGEIIEKNK